MKASIERGNDYGEPLSVGTGLEWIWILPLLWVPLWTEMDRRQVSALVSTQADLTWEIAVWRLDKLPKLFKSILYI